MGGVIPAEIWSELAGGESRNGVVRTRVAPDGPVDIFVAIEQPGSAWLLLFGLAREELAQLLEIPEAAGIAVRSVPAPEGPIWGYAEVRLVDARYEEVFFALADDLVDHVARSSDSLTAIARLSDRLRRWEAFLKIVDPDGLGLERRAGLYGELHVMRAHLLPISMELGIRTWVGPQGAHQDFQAPSWALEVKTSRRNQPVSVRIASERQLDDLGLEFLGLAHVGLEQRHDSGETLPEMVGSDTDNPHQLGPGGDLRRSTAECGLSGTPRAALRSRRLRHPI